MNTINETKPYTGTIPTVGRAVHYYAYGTPGGEFPANVARAATITDVSNWEKDGTISLCVMNPGGLFFNLAVPYAETPTPGCWGWPPRV